MAKTIVQVNGLEELIDKCDADLLSRPLKDFFAKSTTELRQDIQAETPKGMTGNLRSTLRRSTDTRKVPLFGKVTSPLFYALFVEVGTGAHYPPRAKVAGWAEAHGMAAGTLARSIGRKGTKGKFMFAKGEEKASQKIDGWLNETANEIRGEWER